MAFVSAAACDSFTEAARRLSLSQPTLSRSIRELEEVLGLVLFDRSHRGVLLTHSGERLLPLARELLSTHAQTLEGMMQWRSYSNFQFRAVGSTAVMPQVLPVLLKALREEFGSAAMSVDAAASSDVERQVLGGMATLGVSAAQEMQPELRYTKVLDAPLGLLVAPGCEVPSRIESLDDLSEVPVVRLHDRSPVTRLLKGMATPYRAYLDSPISLPCVLSAFETVKKAEMAMVASGVGASHPQAAGMRFIALPHLLPIAEVNVISRRDSPFDVRQERMREILCQSIHCTEWHPSVRRAPACAQRY